MPERDPTCIGRVRHVLGAQVTVALDNELAGIAPIYRGRLQPIGQIGSLVRIPQGLIDLIGAVNLVGIAELAGSVTPAETVQTGERWLQVQLLGEIVRSGRVRFERGVAVYPCLDDPVHFATAEDLRAVFPEAGEKHIRVGKLAAADDVPVCLDVGRLVMRHGAVVGSTGSGKTSAVAALLQGFVNNGWRNANIVVIDPHGEYAAALKDKGSVRSVLGSGANRLRVPHWALPALDILRTFAGSTGGRSVSDRFVELVREQRREFVQSARWLKLDPKAVTEDTPVPFDLRKVWYQLDRENRTTVLDADTEALVKEGNPAKLLSAEFRPYGPGSTPPNQGPYYGVYGSIPELLRLGLRDPRLRFLLEPEADPKAKSDPLEEAMGEWLGEDKPVSILDFSGVPDNAAELAIGVVMDLLFEIAVRSRKDEPGVGRPGPVHVVLEEAHRYLGEDATPKARDAANRIAREGRKYGMGLLLVTQRPSELPDTALAQCGTLLALRLGSQADQGRIRAALPDGAGGLAAALPALRTGEAIISGEALVLPVRALLDLPDPEPLADDPSLAPWRKSSGKPDLSNLIAQWRGTYEEKQ